LIQKFCTSATLILVLLACLTPVALANAQEILLQRDRFWFGVGFGLGSEELGAQLNGSYQFGGNVISMRTAVSAELFDDGFNDYALLYGRSLVPRYSRYHVSAGAGIALVEGCFVDGFLGGCDRPNTVIGLPLELQAFWRPGTWIGFGLYGFANLNQTRSFAGLTLGLQLGRMR
jgi:hypothetical protein